MEMETDREMSAMMKASGITSGIRLKLGTSGEGSLESKNNAVIGKCKVYHKAASIIQAS